jgi:hypothetical protein
VSRGVLDTSVLVATDVVEPIPGDPAISTVTT